VSDRIKFADATSQQIESWDRFIDGSVNGTIFHKRDFLGYHGSRFEKTARWMVALKDDIPIAQITYAVSEESDGRLVAASPYGASYGGLVFGKVPGYAASRDLIAAVIAHCRTEKFDTFTVTPPISCHNKGNMDTYTFALLEQGFRSINRDVSSVVPIEIDKPTNEIISSRARRNSRKAIANGVTVTLGAPIDDFWVPMETTFTRHETRPTHERHQLVDLMQRLPGRIRLDVAYLDGDPVAGVGVFLVNSRAALSFYLCQCPAGESVQALTLAVQISMDRCQSDGYSFFDMGTSSVGMKARENIFRFKEGFSSVGYFRETFEWNAANE